MFNLQTYLGWKIDFAAPAGAPAFTRPDSVSWRVYKNPIALGVGGAAAVLLEFADPRIRTGVWTHSTYGTDPVARSTRTALAAMIGVYGPRDAARRVIHGVTAMHARVVGHTPSGENYRALDPELLDWVSATASWGFLNAYDKFVSPLSDADKLRFYREGEPVARLYGVEAPLASDADFTTRLHACASRFEPHPIVHEFLEIFATGPGAMGLPRSLRRAMARAAVSLLPAHVRATLELGPAYDLTPLGRKTLRAIGVAAERVPILAAPPAQACLRLGLPADFLYRSQASQRRVLAQWTRHDHDALDAQTN